MRPVKLGVLVSGSGSNLQSIIDSIEAGSLSAALQVVISNNPSAFALERAKKHNIPAEVLPHRGYPSREAYDQALVDLLTRYAVELVILAGFMRIVSPVLIRAFPMKIMNIHPSLLPSFPGLDGQKQALDYGVKITGCTVHFVDEGTDTGPIIIQAAVPVYGTDSVDTLKKRVIQKEHEIFPQAIQLYAEGKISVIGRTVRIAKHPRTEQDTLVNPPLTTRRP